MKKIRLLLGILFFFVAGACFFAACSSSKSGCPAADAQVKMGKDGKLPTGGGRSNLFPKSMRKKMR